MNNHDVSRAFLEAANSWVCDGYSLDVRYMAQPSPSGHLLWSASVSLNPLPTRLDVDFSIDSAIFSTGNMCRPGESKEFLMDLLGKAVSGHIELPAGIRALRLDPLDNARYDYYSDTTHRDRWFSELHLQVTGNGRPLPSSLETLDIDNQLRRAEPPFDGLSDLANWLGLPATGTTGERPSISLRVGPPVDLILGECDLVGDRLRLTLHAHPNFDVSRLGLALRAVPGKGLEGRQQVADKIKWRDLGERREGIAHLDLADADNVLTLLSIENVTVRRQWIIDRAKARNNRLLAVQYFDRDLKMLRQALLGSDSRKFEKGVGALLFVIGFTPSTLLETDAPDLIVTTPGGALAIVECTTRIADFSSKVGRLVDRRSALSKSLSGNGHPAEVAAVLVCQLPRNQIAAQAEELRAHKTILVAGEDLEAALERLRFPQDPDEMLKAALLRLQPSNPFD